jgi:NAD-dependent deacetylase
MSVTPQHLDEAARLMARSRHTIALTGAGISVDSNIPAFRGAQGLWDRYDPMEYAHIGAFRANPERVWGMLRELGAIIEGSEPNAGHHALCRLEAMGRLHAVITQNVDGLHRRAGSRRVIEFHGSGDRLVCLAGHGPFERSETVIEATPPTCGVCGTVLKPDVVFYGEPIPQHAVLAAQKEVRRADLVLVLGTSAEVAPASDIPAAAKDRGASVIEINLEPTRLTGSVTDVSLLGSTTTILPKLVDILERSPSAS